MKQVFLGGCERSGTTLLASMLGVHRACLTVPESQFKIEALLPHGQPQNDADLRAAAERIIKSWRFGAWELSLHADSVPWEQIGGSYCKLLEWFVTQYGAHVGKKDFDLWVDHTPENVKYLQTLFELFPDAKGIHIVRDGRAVSASVLPLDWGPNTIMQSAYDWSQKVLFGIAAESVFGKERIYHVRYEALVHEPENVLKELCDWLDIDYDPLMLRNDGYLKPRYYNYKAHTLIGKKPDTMRARAWEEKLSPRQIELFESQTGDLLRNLGYELKYGLKARKVGGKEIVNSMVAELIREFVNRIRGNYRIHRTVRKNQP